MPLFTGTAEIAIRTGADIIPIAMEQRGKHYYANIGENISPSGYTIGQKKELTDFLRDILCILRWDIWERFPVEKRADLPEDAAAQYLEGIMSQTDNGYTVEEINRTRFHDRSVTSPEDTFAFLKELKA